MAPGFPALPTELLSIVTDHLAFEEKLRLSSVNLFYRNALAPQVFQTITLTNNENVAKSALAAVKRYGTHVTELQFKARASLEDDGSTTSSAAGPLQEGFYQEDGDSQAGRSLDGILPEAARDVLGGGHTPNATSLHVRFCYDFYEDDNVNSFQDVESRAEMEEQESQYEWRALMAETWKAISSNLAVRRLVVADIIPKSTSAFYSKDFRSFLGRLEICELSIYGLDNGAGWNINCQMGYLDYVRRLDRLILQKLSSIRQLTLRAPLEGPIGLEGYHHVSLGLQPGQMPFLEHLRLDNIFIGPELISFLQDHSQSMKSLELHNCCAGSTASATNSIEWSRFFEQLCSCQPVLSSFSVFFDKVPLTSEEEFGERLTALPSEESQDVKDARRRLEGDGRLRLFSYRYLDDKYGIWYHDEELNLESFLRGEDQLKYDELVDTVRKKAAR